MLFKKEGHGYWIAAGALLWLLTWAVPFNVGVLDPISRVLLLAMLVVVPLACRLIESVAEFDDPRRSPRALKNFVPFRALRGSAPLAGLFGLVSLLLPVSRWAGVVALGWFLFTSSIAFGGVNRIWSRGWQPFLPGLCLDVGRLYLLVGAIWFVASRLGLEFLGFQEPIVLLTAVHFHYAGFAASVLAGLAGLKLAELGKRPLAYSLGAGGAVLAVPLTAVGILAAPLVEVVSVVVLVGGLLLLASVVVTQIVPHMQNRLAKGLMTISAVCLPLTMTLAVGYAWGEFTQTVIVSIPRMVQLHGWVNSVGFALCGLLAWVLEYETKQ